MRTSLVKREIIAKETMALYFTKPEGFNYRAGQSVDLTLINQPVTDAKGNSRSFSLASAPHEEHLMLACRIRDTAFKNILKELPLGTEFVLDGPFGSFFLHENAKRSAVFIAGGVGVTPFRSMLLDAAHRKLPHQITLFYLNRKEEDFIFIHELSELRFVPSNLSLIPIRTAIQGHLNGERIRDYVYFDTSPIFYLAGSQKMVSATRDLLLGMGVSNDDIRFEEFAGY